jgi:hypothetical protein
MVAHPTTEEAAVSDPLFPFPQPRSYPTPEVDDRPSLMLRFRVRFKRRRLDEQLADGADPTGSPELSLRTAQLRSSEVRTRLARALEKKLAMAYEPILLSIRLQPHRYEIRACREEIHELAERLRDNEPVEVRGMAMTARLLTPGASPFDPNNWEKLRPALRAARRALDPPADANNRLAAAA